MLPDGTDDSSLLFTTSMGALESKIVRVVRRVPVTTTAARSFEVSAPVSGLMGSGGAGVGSGEARARGIIERANASLST
jgi:hypothetical protein